MNELDEFQKEIVSQWTEVHKKSMVTLLILLALREKPMWSKEIERWLARVTSWDISERGLHRTLKRLNQLDLITYSELDAPKTGVKRKNYSLTDFGRGVLDELKETSLGYLSSPEFKNCY